MTDHEKRIRERIHGDDSLYTNVRNGDLRALLADLDAVRGALEKIAKADNSESGCYYTNRANINIARAAHQPANSQDVK